ncbi:alcohol dehydrogenase [Pseudomonas sp. dw_358]|uniref:alcohol dehydrogenase n=1 Tax=Pseudomonas sp. dw_358 TaxID=2720083 RepID=UPI001BD20E7E|nr:alcohol dehydrogenase [Pseudomonas sp. dw_358]
MRAFTVQQFAQPLEAVEVTKPIPQGTEVLVEVTRCGVCHTDLHLHDGYYSLGGGKRLNLRDRGIVPPLVLGHEIYGRLVAKGADAPSGEVGRHYVVYPWLGCGDCDACRQDQDNLCAAPRSIGVVRPGGYADFCLVPHPKYLVDVTGLDPSLAATYACSGLTAYSAINKVEIDRDQELLVILGLGGVGMNGLNIAVAQGYRKIAVADLDPAKRANALANGAQFAFDPGDSQAVLALIAGQGNASAVVDFVGSSETAALGVSMLRKGGTCVIVGLFGGELTLPLPPLAQRSTVIRGSYVGNLAELHALVELAKSGKIAALAVETMDISKINQAFDRLRAGGVNGRLVLSRDEEA